MDDDDDDEYSQVPYHRISCFDNQRCFLLLLKPAIIIEHLFGQSLLSDSMLTKIISKLLFCFVFIYMTLVFVLGVFGRDAIDTWKQLSLYVIPLLTFPCGARVFSSHSYYKFLSRNVTDSVMVRFFVKQPDSTNIKPAAHNREWLKRIALKSVIFPLSIVLIQWAGFLCFVLIKEDSSKTMIGDVVLYKSITVEIWTCLYVTYWSVSIYLVGFVAFQFVFVSRVIVKDTVSLMSLFGSSPFLKLTPVYLYSKEHNCCYNIIVYLMNFLTLDLISSVNDEYVYTNCAQLVRHKDSSAHIDTDVIHSNTDPFPNRVLTSPVGYPKDTKDNIKSNSKDEVVNNMTPKEASEIFTKFISEVEEVTSCFTSFIVIISFFGIANLITHVCLFVYQDDIAGHLDYWTLFRTILFLFVAIRMLVCVLHVSTILGKLPAHLKFIRCSGQLGNQNAPMDSWNGFFELLTSFNLGKRSFGFPLTLRQVASIATFLNMAFLIVLSVFKTKDKLEPK